MIIDDQSRSAQIFDHASQRSHGVEKALLLDECQDVRDHERPANLAAVVSRSDKKSAPAAVILSRSYVATKLGSSVRRGLQRGLLRIKLGVEIV
jgi:hypothetical protein